MAENLSISPSLVSLKWQWEIELNEVDFGEEDEQLGFQKFGEETDTTEVVGGSPQHIREGNSCLI